jgi:hypothetical protein
VAPLDSTSSADVSDLTLQYGTRINLVKRTGSDATVATSPVATSPVAAGAVAAATVATGPVAAATVATGPVAAATVATGPVAAATVATGPVAAATVATAVHFVADTEPTKQDNQTGERLLGIIAAICVLGVTAAIIRAILAQRASGVVGT